MYRKGFPVSDLQDAVKEALREIDEFSLYDEYDYLACSESKVLNRCGGIVMGICDGSAGGEGNLKKLRGYLDTVNSICPDLEEYHKNLALLEEYEENMSYYRNQAENLGWKMNQYEVNSEQWLRCQENADSAERKYDYWYRQIKDLEERQEEIKEWIDSVLTL